METLSLILIMMPIFAISIAAMNIDLIWFGIIIVIVLEMGMITPPVGINVFIVKSLVPDVPMGHIFRGIWPFWFAMVIMLILLVFFPKIALFLPQTIVGG